MNAIKTLALAAGLLAAGAASAAVDVVNPGAGYTYGTTSFSHLSLGPSSSATLALDVYDVDYLDGERDMVQGWDAATSSWVDLGYLMGSDGQNYTTSFTLGASLLDDVAAGLAVKITPTVSGWAYTVNSSTLTTVSAVPETETYAMFLAGLAALGAVSRRRKQA